MSIDDILSFKARDLRNSLGLDLPHPTSKGDLGEDAWISFLRSFLPSRYAVSKGFVFDCQGSISEQIDVIIFDRHHSPLILETPNGESYVTAESVYAVFEVKPTINSQYFKYANNKIESVRKLHRTSRKMICSGKVVEAREPGNILGGILAGSSVDADTLTKYFCDYKAVDIACAAKSATAFRKSNGDIEVSSEREALQAFFYLLLDELYKLGTVAAIDIREYAKVALQSFELEEDDSGED